MKTIAFFNSRAGVGKTSLVYHLGWMFSETGYTIIAADLDPQANLTSMFLDEERLEELWPSGKHPLTIQGVIDPVVRGSGDFNAPHLEQINERIYLLPGDLALAGFEDRLSTAWLQCQDGDNAAFVTMTAFHRALSVAADSAGADFLLIDIGPNLGAINRAALIAADYVAIPLTPDLFSLQGLRTMGPQLTSWRKAWQELGPKNPNPDLSLPSGTMTPIGYVVIQHAMRADRPIRAYQRWMAEIPGEYQKHVLTAPEPGRHVAEKDRQPLGVLKQYWSLMPLAMEARKPMFHLKPSDGAIGAHVEAVRDCHADFRYLAVRIAEKLKL